MSTYWLASGAFLLGVCDDTCGGNVEYRKLLCLYERNAKISSRSSLSPVSVILVILKKY